MLPMSNNGTNGRSSAKKTSVNHNNKNAPSLPVKISTNPTTIESKSNNNENHNLTKSSSAATNHRRDSSSISGLHQTCKNDVRKLEYALPQTQPPQHQQRTEELAHTLDDYKLVYCDGCLISGSLEALIEHMVPTSDYYPERTYVFSFLLSARLFVRPHELLAQISQTWERQQQQSSVNADVVDEARFGNLHVVPASASPLTQRKVSAASQNIASITQEALKQQRSATQKSAQNCIRLLSEWIETFPYDFRDERLMQQVRILARKCVYIDNALGKQVSRILQMLVQRLTALEKYEEFLQSLNAADLNASQHQHYSTSASASYAVATTITKSAASNNTESQKGMNAATITAANSVNSNTNTNAVQVEHEVQGIMDLCPSCAHLAHQLTAIELERLSHIGPEEFVQAFAKEYKHSIASKTVGASSLSTSLNDMKKTRNLESYVEWFNRLSYLTASEIVKYPKKKQRVRIIEYWIETARECFNIGNFNSLMAIIAGLNLAPISRLKKTWSKVQSAKFSVLEHQMDPTSNFNSYRSTLKAAMWRSEGATDERERIIIPFFSLFVKDLYFVNEGCSNRLPNNHINFEKCSQLAKQVMEFNEWKKVSCPFEKLSNVITYLQNSAVLNENTLSMASFECEPPENTEEKGRYKTVKAETKQQLLLQLQEQQQQQHQQQQQQQQQHQQNQQQ